MGPRAYHPGSKKELKLLSCLMDEENQCTSHNIIIFLPDVSKVVSVYDHFWALILGRTLGTVPTTQKFVSSKGTLLNLKCFQFHVCSFSNGPPTFLQGIGAFIVRPNAGRVEKKTFPNLSLV